MITPHLRQSHIITVKIRLIKIIVVIGKYNVKFSFLIRISPGNFPRYGILSKSRKNRPMHRKMALRIRNSFAKGFIGAIFFIYWRTRLSTIRTLTEISVSIAITASSSVPAYQSISIKAKQLHALGMSYKNIVEKLNTSKTTIIRAVNHSL